jgi:hypothetical protein
MKVPPNRMLSRPLATGAYVTSAEAHMPTAVPQIPGSPVDGDIPESTCVGYDVVMSQITAAPHNADLEYHLFHGHHHDH